MFSEKKRATLVGLLAPVLWGLSVGMIRLVEEMAGMARGLALCYLIGAIFALVIFDWPRIGRMPLRYLLCGIPCAIACSVCFTFSLQISDGGRQTLEVGMVNYLWPSLTIIAAILFNGQRARWYVVIGFLLALYGLGEVISGSAGFHPAEMLRHMRDNPLSYLLALCGAIAWALYSSATRAWGGGENPTALIFTIDAAIFGLLALAGGVPAPASFTASGLLICLAAGCVMGGSYAVWTVGVQKGSITILAIASYFTPVLSCLFGAVLLDASLPAGFWGGVLVVVAGSLVCWASTLQEGFMGPLWNRRRS
ncbi:MAG: aromatic amino acid DMT transporter YddG [Mesosutterella sp.]|nr:aromatic amino acid DMT transporter YddG [Mesosutterella sp.]